MSLVFLWGRSVFGCQKVLWKVPPRIHRGFPKFHRGFTKVPPRFRKLLKGSAEGSTKVPATRFFMSRGVSGSLGQIRLGLPKRCGLWKVHQTKVPPRLCKFRDLFALFQQIRFHSLLRFFGQVAVVSEKVLWGVPPTILYICTPTGCCCFTNVLCNCAFPFSPSLLLGPKLPELLTCLTHTNPVCRKRPIISLLLGFSLGLFYLFVVIQFSLPYLRTA